MEVGLVTAQTWDCSSSAAHHLERTGRDLACHVGTGDRMVLSVCRFVPQLPLPTALYVCHCAGARYLDRGLDKLLLFVEYTCSD